VSTFNSSFPLVSATKASYKFIRRTLVGRFILNRLRHRKNIRMHDNARFARYKVEAEIERNNTGVNLLDRDRVVTGTDGRLIHFRS
jgi:hypothetical protein